MATDPPFRGHLCELKTGSPATEVGCFRVMNFSQTANTNAVPYPRDPAAQTTAPSTARHSTSVDATISGEAILYKSLRIALQQAFNTTDNWELHFPGTGTAGGGRYTGNFKLTQFDCAAEDGNWVIASITLELDSDTPPSWTAAT